MTDEIDDMIIADQQVARPVDWLRRSRIGVAGSINAPGYSEQVLLRAALVAFDERFRLRRQIIGTGHVATQ